MDFILTLLTNQNHFFCFYTSDIISTIAYKQTFLLVDISLVICILQTISVFGLLRTVIFWGALNAMLGQS